MNLRLLPVFAVLCLSLPTLSQPLRPTPASRAASIVNPRDSGTGIDEKKWVRHGYSADKKVYRAKGRVILLLRSGARTRLGKAHAFTPRAKASSPLSANAEVVSFDEGSVDFQTLKLELEKDPEVAGVEPDLRVRSSSIREPKIKSTDIDFTAAQHKTARLPRSGKRAKTVRVGLLDTGIDYLHPDLDNAVEKGVNLIYAKPENDSIGGEAADSTEMDYNGHGTKVAGIIGAEWNGIGIDGLSEAKLIGIKAFDKDGNGRLSDVIAGIQWAMDHGIEVLSMSCGTYEYSAALGNIVSEALSRGMLLTAAAGNDRFGTAAYPARYPGVVSVGSLDESDRPSEFSNFGPEVGIYAPGERVLSTNLKESGEPYQIFSGTSAACAHVSGLIALALSEGAGKAEVGSLLAGTAARRLAFFSPGEPEYAAVNQEAFLSAFRKRKSTRLSLTGLGADRLVWGLKDSIKVRYRIQNTGTQPTPKTGVSMKITMGTLIGSVALRELPALKAGESFTGTSVLPESYSQTPTEADISLSLDGMNENVSEGFEARAHVSVLASPRRRLYASALWLNDMEPGRSPGRKLILKIMNLGNVAVPATTVVPRMQQGGHCEYGRVAADVVGPVAAMGVLAPGESRALEVGVPEMDVPATNSFTVMAAFLDGTDTLYNAKKQMQAITKGQLKPLYAQEVHRWIAREAVNLLKLQGIYIPDLMNPQSPYLGGVTPYMDFDEKTTTVTPHDDAWWTSATLAGYTHLTLVNGAHDADETDIVFHYSGMDLFDTHFWKVDEDDVTGHTYGTLGHHHHSALERIRATMFGKSVMSDSYLTKGALDHYKKGYKDAAWYFIGHIVHLIGDLSVPSHIDDSNWHGVWGDAYHDWMDKGNYSLFGSAQIAKDAGGMIDPYQEAALGDPVRFLAYTTAQVGNAFGYGNANNNPFNDDYGASGNRTLLGKDPHYDGYMAQVYASMRASNAAIGLPEEHPMTFNHIAQFEVTDKTLYTTCEWETDFWGSLFDEYLTDCKDHNGHIDMNNSNGMGVGNGDRDMEAIARVNVNYAIRACAGLIYYFAKETGQLNYRALPALNALLLQ
ncbi:MAG TPA: S8 family serine peptidase [Fibrobacteria bacterium]|nr:S8 family serine peptidase [Fibrobacteria bacterium]